MAISVTRFITWPAQNIWTGGSGPAAANRFHQVDCSSYVRSFAPGPEVIMAKPAPWIFLAAVMACQKRYVPTRTTFYGDRAITPATSSSALEQNRKMRAIIMKASAWQLPLTIPTPCPTNEDRFCFAAIARRIFKPIGPTSRIGTRAIARFPLALAWFPRYFYSPSL
jgi:hypothetical protein